MSRISIFCPLVDFCKYVLLSGTLAKIENFFRRGSLGQSSLEWLTRFKKLESRLKWILKQSAPNLMLKFAMNLAQFASKRSPPSLRSSSKVVIIQFAMVALPNATRQAIASTTLTLISRWLNAPFACQRKPWPKPKRPRAPASNSLAKKPALQCWGTPPIRLRQYSNLTWTSASFPKDLKILECPTLSSRWHRKKREFPKKLPLAQSVVAVADLKGNKSTVHTNVVVVVAPSATIAFIAVTANVISNMWMYFETDTTFPLKSSRLPLLIEIPHKKLYCNP